MKLNVVNLDAAAAGEIELYDYIFGMTEIFTDILSRMVNYQVFGPINRSHAIDLPKKVRALALRHALSSKALSGSIMVLDAAAVSEPKTAALRVRLEKLGLTNALVIAGPEVDANLKLAARNIPLVDVLPNAGLNVYDVLRRDTLVLTKDAVEAINARFAEKEAA